MIEESKLAASISVLPTWRDPGTEAPERRTTPFGQLGAKGASLRAILAGLDLVAVSAVWLGEILLHHRQGLQPLGAVLAIVATLIALRAGGLYRSRVCAVRSSEAVRSTVASLVGGGVFECFKWATGQSTTPTLEVALVAAATIVLVRCGFARWLKARHSAGHSLRTIVLVGTNDDALELCTTLISEPELGYRVGAVVGPMRDDAPWAELPGSDSIWDLATVAAKVGANGVILVGSALGADGPVALSQAFDAGLHVQMWAGLPVDSRRIRMTPTFGVPLLYVEPHRSPSSSQWSLRAKRAIDIVGALVVGVAAAPILAVSALMIKLEDGGPVIYRAERIGRFGIPITVFKLRTMVPNASQLFQQVAVLNERTDGPLFKAADDPRITRIGRFLRASSIDELPQLWNVLDGSMSLVGPRPALRAEVEQFDDELRRRHQVRPGITGPWQLEARDNPSFNAYRRYDLAYVDSWSLTWDLAILCGTVQAVVARGLQPLFRAALRRRHPITHQSALPIDEERLSQRSPSVSNVMGK